MIEVPDFIDESRGMTRFQCQHHQVPSTLIPGTGTHTVVLFVTELQLSCSCHRLSIFECLGVLMYSNVMIAMQCILCKANLTIRSGFF